MVKLSYALFALLGSNDVASAFMAKPKAFGAKTELQMVRCVVGLRPAQFCSIMPLRVSLLLSNCLRTWCIFAQFVRAVDVRAFFLT